jgi:hypothetical protein
VARIGSTCLVLFGMWVALASSAWAQATPGYTMHQITYPGSTQTWVYGLNDKKNTVGLPCQMRHIKGGSRKARHTCA